MDFKVLSYIINGFCLAFSVSNSINKSILGVICFIILHQYFNPMMNHDFYVFSYLFYVIFVLYLISSDFLKTVIVLLIYSVVGYVIHLYFGCNAIILTLSNVIIACFLKVNIKLTDKVEHITDRLIRFILFAFILTLLLISWEATEHV